MFKRWLADATHRSLAILMLCCVVMSGGCGDGTKSSSSSTRIPLPSETNPPFDLHAHVKKFKESRGPYLPDARRLDGEIVSAAFCPISPGGVRNYVTFLRWNPRMIMFGRHTDTDRNDGILERKIVKDVTAFREGGIVDEENSKRFSSPTELPPETKTRRIKDGFIESSQSSALTARPDYWEAILKLGAKAGDGWERTMVVPAPESMRGEWKLVEFIELDGKPTAVVELVYEFTKHNATFGDSSGYGLRVEWYSQGVGLVRSESAEAYVPRELEPSQLRILNDGEYELTDEDERFLANRDEKP